MSTYFTFLGIWTNDQCCHFQFDRHLKHNKWWNVFSILLDFTTLVTSCNYYTWMFPVYTVILFYIYLALGLTLQLKTSHTNQRSFWNMMHIKLFDIQYMKQLKLSLLRQTTMVKRCLNIITTVAVVDMYHKIISQYFGEFCNDNILDDMKNTE